MNAVLFLIIGSLLVFLGGKDPWLQWLKLRQEGNSTYQSFIGIIPLFIIPWPRSVNKRLIWLSAGFFLMGCGLYDLLYYFYI